MDLRTHTLTFGAAGTIPVPVSRASFLRIKSATTAVDVALFQQRKKVGELEDASAGDKVRAAREGDEFDAVTVTSPSAQTVVVVVGLGDVDSSSLSGDVGITPASGITSNKTASIADSARGSIAANLSRKSLILTNPSTSGGSIWVGDSAVDDTTGTEVVPGEKYRHANTAALYIYNKTGAAALFPYNEET